MSQQIQSKTATEAERNKLDKVLRLGWKVDSDLTPIAGAFGKPSELLAEQMMVKVDAENVAAHTAIIAQSGGGKSFFVGRLIEELALSCQARCVVFDPNGDYSLIHNVETDKIWTWSYDYGKRSGFLTHDTESDFSKFWNNARIYVKSAIEVRNCARNLGDQQNKSKIPYFDWHGLVSEQLAALIAPRTEVLLRRQVIQTHEFVKVACNKLQEAKLPEGEQDQIDLIDFCHLIVAGGDLTTLPPNAQTIANQLSAEYVKHSGMNEGQRLYFTAAEEFRNEPIIETRLSLLGFDKSYKVPGDIEIVDLPSVSKPNVRDLVISSLVEHEWDEGVKRWMNAKNPDNRSPTFIVLDEAHNYIPEHTWEAGQEVIRDQFRRIAAEGRKFGIFLIIISQRPDKLDPFILSECKNHVIMKLASKAIVKHTMDRLGLDDSVERDLVRCVELTRGVGLLTGEWMSKRHDNPVRKASEFFYGTARRTKEGGRNLNKDFWARPFAHLTNPVAS